MQSKPESILTIPMTVVSFDIIAMRADRGTQTELGRTADYIHIRPGKSGFQPIQ